jgi:hypothetical protein
MLPQGPSTGPNKNRSNELARPAAPDLYFFFLIVFLINYFLLINLYFFY